MDDRSSHQRTTARNKAPRAAQIYNQRTRKDREREVQNQPEHYSRTAVFLRYFCTVPFQVARTRQLGEVTAAGVDHLYGLVVKVVETNPEHGAFTYLTPMLCSAPNRLVEQRQK